MKVAIDLSPLLDTRLGQHKVRGVGFYLDRLKVSLEKYCKDLVVVSFTKEKPLISDADLVHYPYFEPFFFSLPFIKRHKTVVTVHDLIPLVFPRHFPPGKKGKFRWFVQRVLLKQVEAIITDSEASKNDIVKLLSIPIDRVHVIYLAAGEEFTSNGRTTKEVKDLQQKYNLPENFGLYVGDVTWNKNIPRLVRAIHKSNIPFVFVGKTLAENEFDRKNPWNKDLVEFQDSIAKVPYIQAVGFVSTADLIGLYQQAAFLILPSLYEGFGLPVLEAMKCGCPVIATQEGSLPEVAGDAALYVDAYDEGAIATEMKRLFFDKKLQEVLRKKGVKQADSFSWERTAKETRLVYASLVNHS